MIENTEKYLQSIEENQLAIFVNHERNEIFFPLHSHSKGQLSYVEGGIAYVHLEDKTLIIPSRHYIWIPRGMKHFIIMRKWEINRSLYFDYQHDDADPFYDLLGIYPISALLIRMLAFTENWHGAIHPDDKRFHFLAGIKFALPEISKNALSIVSLVTEDQRMHPIVNFLYNNFDDVITLSSISKKMGFSDRTLSRLFQSTLNMSFLQYLKLVRVIKIMEIMMLKDKSISEIAYAVGYTSVAAFSDTFLQITSLRPSDFIKIL